MRIALLLVLIAILVPTAWAAPLQAQSPPQLDARIEIVWPHDLQGNPVPVTQADRANITVYLFERGTRTAFCPSEVGKTAVSLMVAANNGVLSLSRTGVHRKVVEGSVSFFVWDFNDVDVSFARNVDNRLYFSVRDFVSVFHPEIGPGYLTVQSNVWAHAADARTLFPVQDIPTATAPAPPPGLLPYLDPKIQIVWPHDQLGREASVTQGDLVNISVTIFHHGTLTSVPPEYDQTVQLHQALNQEVLRPVAVGQKRLVTVNGITYPVWDFNNIDVSAAKDPSNKYFFMIKTSGSEGSNIWVHGADGRTYFPTPDVPERGCP
jgi:hypothetical protein